MKAHIYPVLRESAKFYLQILYYDERQKRYVASPTYSPEHGPVTIGNTYEQSMVQAFLLAFAEAARVLKTDDDLRRQAEDTAAQMNPYQISSKTGMLKEWYEEDEEDFDRSAVEQAHRHTSYLLGLYPAHTMCDCPEEIQKAWDTGAYTGLCAIGGFTIDLTWEKGEIKTLCIASSLAGSCRIRMQKPQQIVDSLGKRISWNYDKGVVEFSAGKGKYYTVQINRN